MLETLRRGSRWLMILIIGAIALVFTLYLGFQGSFQRANPEGVVIRVAERSYDLRDFDRYRLNLENAFRQQMGDAFDATAAKDYIDQSAASALLRNGLFAYEAERMGLVAGDDEVRDYFRSIPGVLDSDGTVLEDVVANIERQYGNATRFRAALRDELLARKAQQTIWKSVEVSSAEALDSLRYAQEEVDVAFVRFDGAQRPEGLEASEEAVQALLADEEGTELRDAYEARRHEFDRPEEVRARHILVRKATEGEERDDPVEVLTKARERYEAGETFADLATELSDDPGSKANGGDLGFFPRGRMVAAFEEAAFSLEPGTLSEIVESSFGHHLILVEEKRAAELVPFEEAREQIARDLALSEAAEEAARARAEEIGGRLRGGEKLVDVARELELSVERPEPLRRRPDGFVAGLGAAPDVMRAVFALTEEGASDPTVYEVGDRKFVLVQLLERRAPSDEELAEQVEEERSRLRESRRSSSEQAWLDARRSELDDAGELVYDLSILR